VKKSVPNATAAFVRLRLQQAALALLVSGASVVPAAAATAAADAASAAADATPADSEASAESSGALQEIVVTATRREETLQKVPIAVSAIGSAELEQRGIIGLQDLGGGKIPELRMQPFAGNQTISLLAIRGFASPAGQDVTFENPVPVYVDDVYYGRASGLGLELNDLERIEVLRGPQGTLFGKNAEGGAVRMISKAPSGEFSVRATLDGGNFGYKKGTAHIDLPAVGIMAAKIDLVATDNRGWQTNPSPGEQNFGKTQSEGGKLSLRFKPGDTFLLDFATDFTNVRSAEVFNQLISSDDPYTTAAWIPEPSRIENLQHGTYRPLDYQRYWGQRLTATWNINSDLTLKSVTAYRNDTVFLNNTATTSSSLPGAFLGSAQPYLSGPDVTYDIKHNQTSEELQLLGNTGDVQWVTGAFFIRENGQQIQTTYFGTTFPNAVLLGPDAGFFPISVGKGVALDPPLLVPGLPPGAVIRNTAYAAFGQATWRPAFDNKLALTAGVRVARDEKEATRPFGSVYAHAYDTVASQTCPCTQPTLKENHVPVTVSAAYDWNPDAHSYVKFSSGYQAGAYGLSSQTFQPVKASTVKSYEIGHKQEFFDHTFRVNAAVYYQDWQDVQASVQTLSASTQEYYNGPPVKGEGVELDTTWVASSALAITLGGTYSNLHTSSIANPFPAPGGVVGGVDVFGNVLQSPRWTGSLSVLYDIAKTSYGTWRANVDVTSTAQYFAVPNIPTPMPGYTLVNARFGLAEIKLGGDATLDITAWGKNLGNKSYMTYEYAAPGVVPGTQGIFSPFGEPRTYGLQLAAKF
jgi:iron complex outermembrane recepter protein